jgi:hypothetical protein
MPTINSGDTDFVANKLKKKLIDDLIADLKDLRDFFVSGVLKATGTWDPASIADKAALDKDVTVAGAVLGDFAVASLSLDQTGLGITAQVTATDTVTITLINGTGGAVDLASLTYRILVFKKSYWYDLLPLAAARVAAT